VTHITELRHGRFGDGEDAYNVRRCARAGCVTTSWACQTARVSPIAKERVVHSHPIQVFLRAEPDRVASAESAYPSLRRPVSRKRARDAAPPSATDRLPRVSLPVALASAVAFVLFVALAALAQVARAQSAPAPSKASVTEDASVGAALRRSADRHGLWGSVGVGRASAGLSCEACARETTRAYAFHGTLGVRLSPRFLVGAETFAWLDVIGGGVDRIARGTYLIARSYPFEGSPLFLHGGLGLAGFQVNDGDVAFTTRSPSLSLAAGYDWRVGSMTFTPSITAITSTGGRLNSDRTGNAITDNARLGLLRSSLALSWFR
jgi:hypothetical protein